MSRAVKNPAASADIPNSPRAEYRVAMHIPGLAVTTPETIAVETAYRDALGITRASNPDTVALISRELRERHQRSDGPIVARRGHPLPASAAEVVTESGATMRAPATIDATIPLGYHRLIHASGLEQQLIVCPTTCHLPRDVYGWGLAVQLYAARSHRSWGVGDLSDLSTIAQWCRARGARFVLINPLHAPLMTAHLEASPYFASSRLYRNPLYLDMERIAGSGRPAEFDRLRVEGRALNAADHIQRDAAWALKLHALETIWAAGDRDAGALDTYIAAHGPSLQRYALFCVLTEQLGPDWRTWPIAYRDHTSGAVAEFALQHAPRIRFHQWLQYLMDAQLRAARPDSLALMQDLAVGVSSGGADCWTDPDLFADGFSIGAPPDRFNTQGQNWALPPWHPIELERTAFRPFIEILRSAFAIGGAVRIDHIMGLFRLWWIPAGAAPHDGAYVRYPSEQLLNILALESRRARAFVVGEDLGTVAPGVRTELRRRNILSYRLLAFGNRRGIAHFPTRALTAVTTHDLPTVIGLWTGSDVAAQRERGLHPNEQATTETRRRLAAETGASETTALPEVVIRTHAVLAQSPSQLVCAALDDLALSELRPNMPGTVSPTWPNWQIPLPEPLEEVLASPVANAVAAALARNRSQPAQRAAAD